MVNCNVEIGDKIFIGGLYGSDFKMINHKIGKIDKLMFTSNEYYSTYLADVRIDNMIFPINLTYVYKINDLDTYDYDGILDGDSPLEYYFTKFKIIESKYNRCYIFKMKHRDCGYNGAINFHLLQQNARGPSKKAFHLS